MSKLFEAINRLEADTGQAVVESPFGPELMDGSETKPKHNAKKTLILASVLLILAVAAGFGVLFMSKKMAMFDTPRTEPHAIKPDKKPIQLPEKTTSQIKQIGKDLKANVTFQKDNSQTKADIEELLEKTTVMRSSSKAKKEINDINTEEVVKKEKKVDKNPINSNSTRSIPVSSKSNFTKQNLAPLVSNPLILNTRQKRLLYRAEKLRKSGLKEQALDLYKKLWKRSHNPLIANNLAAMLMEKGLYHQARNILEQAVTISPEDNDLRYNLEQVKAFLEARGKTAN